MTSGSKLVLRRPYSRMPMEMGPLCWERQDGRAEEKSGCQGRKRAGQEQTRMVSEGVWLWDCPLLSCGLMAQPHALVKAS